MKKILLAAFVPVLLGSPLLLRGDDAPASQPTSQPVAEMRRVSAQVFYRAVEKLLDGHAWHSPREEPIQVWASRKFAIYGSHKDALNEIFAAAEQERLLNQAYRLRLEPEDIKKFETQAGDVRVSFRGTWRPRRLPVGRFYTEAERREIAGGTLDQEERDALREKARERAEQRESVKVHCTAPVELLDYGKLLRAQRVIVVASIEDYLIRGVGQDPESPSFCEGYRPRLREIHLDVIDVGGALRR
jgi:hypothetical protein